MGRQANYSLITPAAAIEDINSNSSPNSNYDQYGGWLSLPIANSSGYFRTATVGGRNWFVTPAGHAYFSLGVNLISFGQKPAINDSYDQRMFERYRNNPASWANDVAAQLLSWNFNTVGAFSGSDIRHHGLAETRLLDLSKLSLLPPYNVRPVNANFADVFDPAFAAAVSQIIATGINASDITDPWLIGWFLDNELVWYGCGSYTDIADGTLSEDFIALPRAAAGKIVWVHQLMDTYGTIDKLNAQWGTSYPSFDSLYDVTQINAYPALLDKFQFFSAIADKYYNVTTGAVRARDPNHLILSDRYLGGSVFSQVVAAANSYVDVLCINLYEASAADNLNLDNLDFAAQFGKPVLLSEYCFHAISSGMPNYKPPNLPPLKQSRTGSSRRRPGRCLPVDDK